ncbi:hypothetical protein QD460_31055 [Rhizobium jaguaris]|uniref:hypothetical protein n=1 Tax=Rhizobium jaguaris TaxID=1312183 RepID=UPI0039BEE3A4
MRTPLAYINAIKLTLEKAANIANHSSTRTTQLYDRRSDDVNLDEIERILV